MVKPEVKAKIVKLMALRLREHAGLDSFTFETNDYYDECFIVQFPPSVEGVGQETFDALKSELERMPEVSDVCDTGLRNGSGRKFEINVNDGYWTHTEEDGRRIEKILRIYTDPAAAKQMAEERRLEKLEHWRDYLIPVPPPPKHWTTELYLTMQYEPYDWIKNGEKTTEFRAYTPNYVKRILSHPLKTVKFQRGYGGPGRPVPEQMVFEIERISLYDMETRASADPANPTPIVPTHFAIDLGRRIR